MSEKIGVITTGGTIGSILVSDAMAVDASGAIVRREIDALCAAHGFEVKVVPAFNKNSEDLTPADWARLIADVEKMLAAGTTRIVVTHGTDTLAYSATALGLVFQNRAARICLTGSFHALEAENSDGPLNLLAAFHAVADNTLPEGVTVAFRSDASNSAAGIFAACDVHPMRFDAHAFDAVAGGHLATFDRASGLKVVQHGHMPSLPALDVTTFDPNTVAAAARHVLYLECYPGLAFDAFDPLKLNLLLIGLYHSGTAPSLPGEGALVEFLTQNCERLPVLAATFPSAQISVPYHSTAKLIVAGLKVVKDLPPHVVYVFSVLAMAAGASADDVVKKLKPWLF